MLVCAASTHQIWFCGGVEPVMKGFRLKAKVLSFCFLISCMILQWGTECACGTYENRRRKSKTFSQGDLTSHLLNVGTFVENWKKECVDWLARKAYLSSFVDSTYLRKMVPVVSKGISSNVSDDGVRLYTYSECARRAFITLVQTHPCQTLTLIEDPITPKQPRPVESTSDTCSTKQPPIPL